MNFEIQPGPSYPPSISKAWRVMAHVQQTRLGYNGHFRHEPHDAVSEERQAWVASLHGRLVNLDLPDMFVAQLLRFALPLDLWAGSTRYTMTGRLLASSRTARMRSH